MNVGRMTDGRTVRLRRRCVEEGLEAVLNRKEQLNRRAKVLDGEAEARLVAIACGDGDPPEGYARWSLRLLADPLGGVRDRGWRESGDGSSYAKKKRP